MAPKALRARPVNLDFTDTITILVGEQRKAFTLPKQALSNSLFFTKSLEWRLKGLTQEQGIILADTTVANFASYIDWAINGMNPPGKLHRITKYLLLFELWCLGDFLSDAAFRNTITSMILAMYRTRVKVSAPCLPCATAVELAWNNTARGSSLRQLILDMHVGLNPAEFVRIKDALPQEFVEDLCERALGVTSANLVKKDSFYQEEVDDTKLALIFVASVGV